MGEITLISSTMPDLLPMRYRTPGIHVSDIIRELCIERGHYKRHTSPPIQMMFEYGNAFEWAIKRRMRLEYPDRYIEPGELILDGVPFTIDLYDFINYIVHEFKVTWMSMKHRPDSEKFLKYWWQIMAYCKGMGINIGVLHVCYVCGNYADEFVGYRCWRQVFTDEDLDRNWDMLMEKGVRLEAQGFIGTPEPNTQTVKETL